MPTVVHHLKTWPLYFESMVAGIKTFECRNNDRNFQVGDILILNEYESDTGYTGRSIPRVVTYVMVGPRLGLAEGWCIMGLK